MGRGNIMAKTVYSVIPKKMYGVIPKAAYGVDLLAYAELTVYITAYYVSSWTQAIQDACAALKTLGGGTILFPAGDYLIKPSLITVSGSNITWQGIGTARLYTTETVLWNICINITGDNIVIDNLAFDHRGDSALLPTKDPYKGAISIYAKGAGTHTYIKNCTFYSYGIVTVLIDNYGGVSPELADCHGNHVYWQRKVDTLYDVSAFHIHAITEYVYDNIVEGVITAFSTYIPRSGFELHFPNGYVTNNTIINCEVGILYVPWGSYETDYDASYVGAVLINNNIMTNIGAIGFELWTGFGDTGRNMKNLTIEDNTIGLYFKNNAYSKPAAGIKFYKGGSYVTEAYDITIRNNAINFTFDTAYAANLAYVRSFYYHMQYGEETGAFCFNVASTLKRINVYGNTVSQYPYSLLNLYRRSGSVSVIHDNISFHDNAATNSCYAEPLLNITTSKACFTLGYSDIVSVVDNTISNPGIALQDQEEQLAYLTNLTYTGNTFT
jgi:hypothetical protein